MSGEELCEGVKLVGNESGTNESSHLTDPLLRAVKDDICVKVCKDTGKAMDSLQELENSLRVVSGVIVQQRSHGKRLRFCQVRVSKCLEDALSYSSTITGQSNLVEQTKLDRSFQRFTDNMFLDSNSQASDEQGNIIIQACFTHGLFVGSAVAPQGQTVACQPFPEKRAHLRTGDIVRLVLWTNPVEEQPRIFSRIALKEKWYVYSWERILACPPNNKRKQDAMRSSGVNLVSNSLGRTTVPLCRSLLRGMECKVPNCPYRHKVTTEEEQELRLASEARSAKLAKHACEQAAYDQIGLDGDHTLGDATEKQEKKKRAEVFAGWLVSTFGSQLLASGTGLLDIAGGKGNVSIQTLLQSKSKDQRCTIIDPVVRRSALKKRTRKQLARQERKLPEFIADKFDEEFAGKSEENAKLVKEASVFVGMHPDQATGAIVESALENKKPFAVVPCCVYTIDFPDRKIAHPGKQGTMKVVETLNDLITWLRSKHPNMRTGHLNFCGRNKVLYMKTEDYSS